MELVGLEEEVIQKSLENFDRPGILDVLGIGDLDKPGIFDTVWRGIFVGDLEEETPVWVPTIELDLFDRGIFEEDLGWSSFLLATGKFNIGEWGMLVAFIFVSARVESFFSSSSLTPGKFDISDWGMLAAFIFFSVRRAESFFFVFFK